VLELIAGRAGELRQLVEMLLFLARADAEALLPDLQAVELGQWLGERLGDWRSHARAGDLRLEVAKEPCWARVHPPLLAQLFDNLLDNACKYSSPATAIIVRLKWQKDEVCLDVEDAGEGIAASDLPHIFGPFYRSVQARSRGKSGAGLGLAVAQRIAAALGGRLSVESQIGKGSRFVLMLPGCHLNLPECAMSATGLE
jgi:signal transduction histidine kinase